MCIALVLRIAVSRFGFVPMSGALCASCRVDQQPGDPRPEHTPTEHLSKQKNLIINRRRTRSVGSFWVESQLTAKGFGGASERVAAERAIAKGL